MLFVVFPSWVMCGLFPGSIVLGLCCAASENLTPSLEVAGGVFIFALLLSCV